MPISQLTKEESGELLRKRREGLGLRQEQVIEAAGIPTITQLSEYENGKVNIARSKYLPVLAQVLRLTEDDIRAINPAAVIQVAAPERKHVHFVNASGGGMDLPGYPTQLFGDPSSNDFPAGSIAVSEEGPLPDALQEAIAKFGSEAEYAGLTDESIIAQLRLAQRLKNPPKTAGEWIAFYSSNKRWLDNE